MPTPAVAAEEAGYQLVARRVALAMWGPKSYPRLKQSQCACGWMWRGSTGHEVDELFDAAEQRRLQVGGRTGFGQDSSPRDESRSPFA